MTSPWREMPSSNGPDRIATLSTVQSKSEIEAAPKERSFRAVNKLPISCNVEKV